MSDMQKNVTSGRRKGCTDYSPEFKQQLVAASCEPGIRQHKAKPQLKSLESQLREKMKTLSRHSELVKAFAYALNQWLALTYYAEDGWAEADNNLAENALRMVCLERKN